MKKQFKSGIVGCLLISLGVLGCGQAASTSQEAIDQAQAKQTTEAKIDYLVQQAQTFLNKDQHQDAIHTSQYILSDLDQTSAEAQKIIQTAKAELEELAQKKLDEAKAEAGKQIDDVKGKIGSFGQ